MLIKNHLNLEQNSLPEIKRFVGGRETRLGAFAEGTSVTLRLTLPRVLGASGAVLRMARVGEGSFDLPFEYIELKGSNDIYSVSFEGKLGLLFYQILLIRGNDTLFMTSLNNLDYELTDSSGRLFHLLFYKKDFKTPEWVKGGTMYHIFVDRFYRGEGEVTLHGRLNDDWENGIPQYAERPGAPLSNDVFFGGNLWGVIEKLGYLKSLGVTIIYLSPIFASASNHRYDTADYEKIDMLLGGDEAFDALIAEAHKLGMKVILDGVFNHTGDDSRYFNRRGNYPEIGAYQSQESPYSKWFSFTEFPDTYESWWGIDIMPRLCHSNSECRHYFTGKNGICEYWLKRGADGWRLDVADELSDDFLDELTAVAKNQKDAFIIGEVWENAVTKTAYSRLRKYFWGFELDSVMNYPLKNAIIALLKNSDSEFFYNTVTELYSSYPKPVLDCLMNIISTHDTERITTLLGDNGEGEDKTNAELSVMRLSPENRKNAVKLLKLASVIQYTMFGIPSLYYGDETGLEGYHDPFCRMPFPWGKTDPELLRHYKRLGALRKRYTCLKDGDFEFIACTKEKIAYRRKNKSDSLEVQIDLVKKTFSLI